MKFLLAVGAGLLFASGAFSQSVPKAGSTIDKSAIENYVRHLFVWGRNIKVEVSDPQPSPLPGFAQVSITGSTGQASQTEIFHVSPDGLRLIRGSIFDLRQDPFADDLRRVRTEGEPSVGSATAPVTIVMFSDFQCSYCREEARILSENVRKSYTKDVKLVYKEFPLEQIHPWARKASIAGRCVFRQDAPAFWAYHDWIFGAQTEITDDNFKARLLGFAKTQNWDVDKLTACTDLRSTEADVDRNIREGRSLGINSTPTLFINGRRLVGRLDWANLKQVIDHEIEYVRGKNVSGGKNGV